MILQIIHPCPIVKDLDDLDLSDDEEKPIDKPAADNKGKKKKKKKKAADSDSDEDAPAVSKVLCVQELVTHFI